MSLRIATWNVYWNRDYDAIAAKLAQLDVDICALQEVALDPAGDVAAVLRLSSGHASGYHWYFAPALEPDELDGKSVYFGLAMLSRVPLHGVAAFQLGPLHADWNNGGAEREPRILQVARLPLAAPVFLGNTHLASTKDWSSSPARRSQAARIANIVRPLAARGQMILCGDFNSEPPSSDFEEIRQTLPCLHASKEATYIGEPGWPPIDFFWSSVPLQAAISVHGPDGLSDHNIVVATLEGFESLA
jgi:endonuclease/exonuclease/phosphatase family metal-dependent hydrolase